MIDDKQVRELAEKIAALLTNRDNRFSVEVRGSVVMTRGYIGASKHDKNEHYIIQIDKA